MNFPPAPTASIAWLPTLSLEKLLLPHNFAHFYYKCQDPNIDFELQIRLRLSLDQEQEYFTKVFFTRLSDFQEHTALAKFYEYKLYKLLLNVASDKLAVDYYGVVRNEFLRFEYDISYLFNIDIGLKKHLSSDSSDTAIAEQEAKLSQTTPLFIPKMPPSFRQGPAEIADRYLDFLNPLKNTKSPMSPDEYNDLIAFTAKAVYADTIPPFISKLDYVVKGKIEKDRVTASFCMIQRHFSPKRRLPLLMQSMRALFDYDQLEQEETTRKSWTTNLKKYFPEVEDEDDN